MKIFKEKKSKINWTGSSEVLNKGIDYSTIAVKRMTYIFLIISICFSIICSRLYYLQILKNEDFSYKLSLFNQNQYYKTSPRGEIYDRNNNPLVTNTQVINMVYFPPKDIKDNEEWDLAYLIADYFEIDYSYLNERDYKDLYILKYPKEASAKITDEEWLLYKDKKLSDLDIYELKLNRISNDDLKSFTDKDKESYAIKLAMDNIYGSNNAIIKTNLTQDEVSFLAENKELFKGFDIEYDWERNYNNDLLLKQVFGKISNTTTGIPKELENYYLGLGYLRNDRVGITNLELQYNSLLFGTKSIYEQSYDSLTGIVQSNELVKGQKGYDLRLSFDVELQKFIEEKSIAMYSKISNDESREYLTNISFVVMDPNNGDVLAMSTAVKEDDTVYIDPTLTYLNSVSPGSTVKGAVVYLGLDRGLIKPNEIILDQPVYIKDTAPKKSWKNLGYITDIQALSMSSNVYMFNIAMRLGNANYVPYGPLNIDSEAFDILRNNFSSFGLGAKTGIDLPNESIGFKGDSRQPGLLLDFSIGQYDTYTTMQLAQYVSTIANGGYRIAPRILLEAYKEDGDNKNIVYQNDVTILNTIDNKEALKRVQTGFIECSKTGICSPFRHTKVTLAAKTGTAETFIYDEEKQKVVKTLSHNLIAYAPAEDPQIAIACTLPHAMIVGMSRSNLCYDLINDVINEYF